jgi:hypothetical protein
MSNEERAVSLRGKVRQATKDKLDPVLVKGEPYWEWEHKEILKFIEAGDDDKTIKNKIKKKRNYYSKQDVKKEKAKVAKKISKIEDPAAKAAEKAKISTKSKQEAADEIEKARLEWMGELENIEHWENPPAVAGMKKVVLFDPKQIIMTNVPAAAGKQDRTGIAWSNSGLRGGGGSKFSMGAGVNAYRLSAGDISHSAGRALAPNEGQMEEYKRKSRGLSEYGGERYDKFSGNSGASRTLDDMYYGTDQKFGFRHSNMGPPIHFPVPKPDPKKPETWEPPTSDFKERKYKVGVGQGLLKNPEEEDKTIKITKKLKIGHELNTIFNDLKSTEDKPQIIRRLAAMRDFQGASEEAIAEALEGKWAELEEGIIGDYNVFGGGNFDTNPEIIIKNVEVKQGNPFEWQTYEANDQGEDLETANWHQYSPLLKGLGGMPIYEYGYAEQGRQIRSGYGGYGYQGRAEYEWEIHKEDNGTRKPVRRIANIITELGEESEQYKYLMSDWKKWRERWDMEESMLIKRDNTTGNRWHSDVQSWSNRQGGMRGGSRVISDMLHSREDDRRTRYDKHLLWADKEKIINEAKDEGNWTALSDPKSNKRYPEEEDEDPHHLFTIGSDPETTAPWKGMRLLNPFYIVIYTGLGLAYIKNKNSLQYFGKLPYVATEFGQVNFKYSEVMGWQDFVRDVELADTDRSRPNEETGADDGRMGLGTIITGKPELETIEWERPVEEEEGERINRDKYVYANDLLNLYSNFKHDGYTMGSGNGPWSVFAQFWNGGFKLWGSRKYKTDGTKNYHFREFQLGINNIVLDADPYNLIHTGAKKRGEKDPDEFESEQMSRVVAVVEQYQKLKDIYKQNSTPDQILSGEKFSALEENWKHASPKILKNWNMWGTHPLEKYRSMPTDWVGYRPHEPRHYDSWETPVPLVMIEGGFFRVGTIGDDYYAYPILFDDDIYIDWNRSEDRAEQRNSPDDEGKLYSRPVKREKKPWDLYKPEVYYEYKDGEEGDRGIKRTRLLFDKTDGVQMGRHDDPVSRQYAEKLNDEHMEEEDEPIEPRDRMDLLDNPKSKDWAGGKNGIGNELDRMGASMIGKSVGSYSSQNQSTIRGIDIDQLIEAAEGGWENGDWGRGNMFINFEPQQHGHSSMPEENKIYHYFDNQKIKTGPHRRDRTFEFNSPAHYLIRFVKRELSEEEQMDPWEQYFKTRKEHLEKIGVPFDIYEKPVFKIKPQYIEKLNRQRAPLPFWTTLEAMIQFPEGSVQQDHPWDQWASIGRHWVLKDSKTEDLLPNQIAWIKQLKLEKVNEDTYLWVNGGNSGALSRWANYHRGADETYLKGHQKRGADEELKKPYHEMDKHNFRGFAQYMVHQWGFYNDYLYDEMFGGSIKDWLNGGTSEALKRTFTCDFPYITGRPEFQCLVSGFIIPPKYKRGMLGHGGINWEYNDEGPIIGMVKDINKLNQIMGGDINTLNIEDIYWGRHMNPLGLHPMIHRAFDEGDMEMPILTDPYDRNEVVECLTDPVYNQSGLVVQTAEELNEHFGKYQLEEGEEPQWEIVGGQEGSGPAQRNEIWVRSPFSASPFMYSKEAFARLADNPNPEHGQVVNWRNKKKPYQLHVKQYDKMYKHGFVKEKDSGRDNQPPLNPVRLPYHFVASGGDLTQMPYEKSAKEHFSV